MQTSKRPRAFYEKAPSPAMVHAKASFQNETRRQCKYVDVHSYTLAVDAGGNTGGAINATVFGYNSYNRIGRKITMKSLAIRGLFTLTDDTAGPVKARLVVVYDQNSKTTAPAWGDIFQSTDPTGVTSSDIDSGKNISNRNRFKILFDYTTQLGTINTNGANAYASGHPISILDTKIELCELQTTYNDFSGIGEDIFTSGTLYIYVIASRDNATGFNYTGGSRLKFYDEQ